MVIEIVSPFTRDYELNEKRNSYHQYKVKETWFIDKGEKEVLIDILKKDRYITSKYREGKVFSCTIEGFWIDTIWLFEEPLRNPQEVLLKIGGKDYISFIKRLIEKTE